MLRPLAIPLHMLRLCGSCELSSLQRGVFLVLYTRVDDDRVVLSPLSKDLREFYCFVVGPRGPFSSVLYEAVMKSLSELGYVRVSVRGSGVTVSSGSRLSSEIPELSEEVMERVERVSRLVRSIDPELLNNLCLRVLGIPRRSVARFVGRRVDEIVESILSARRVVDRVLSEFENLVSEAAGGKLLGEAAAGI